MPTTDAETNAPNRDGADPAFEALVALVTGAERLFVLTGAGCSTGSGIPDYRDTNGEWKRAQPVQFREFVDNGAARRRYWAHSLLGWRVIREARPTAAHEALARLEAADRLHWLVTQNVDGLHRAAGSRRVTDLHGTLDEVECLACERRESRADMQAALRELNPDWEHLDARAAPDGDAETTATDFSGFSIPGCAECGGTLKPSVVFFGESVPRGRVATALARLAEADALLVVGSSLMVYSGFRFVREALRRGLPTGLVNIGRTRTDGSFDVEVRRDCGETLSALARRAGA